MLLAVFPPLLICVPQPGALCLAPAILLRCHLPAEPELVPSMHLIMHYPIYRISLQPLLVLGCPGTCSMPKPMLHCLCAATVFVWCASTFGACASTLVAWLGIICALLVCVCVCVSCQFSTTAMLIGSSATCCLPGNLLVERH